MKSLNYFFLILGCSFILFGCDKEGTITSEQPPINEQPNENQVFTDAEIAQQGTKIARAKNTLASTINSLFSGILIAAPEQLMTQPLSLPYSCPTITNTPGDTPGNNGDELLIDYGNMCYLPNNLQVGGQILIEAPAPIMNAPCCPGLQDATAMRPAFFQFESNFNLGQMTIIENQPSGNQIRPKFFKVSTHPLIFEFKVGSPYSWDVVNGNTGLTTNIEFLESDASFLQVKVGDDSIDDLDYNTLINSKYDMKLNIACHQAPIYTQVEVDDENGGSTQYNVLTLSDLEFDFVGCNNLRGGELMFFPGSYIDCNRPPTNIYNFITFGVDMHGNPTNECSDWVRVRCNCDESGTTCSFDQPMQM